MNCILDQFRNCPHHRFDFWKNKTWFGFEVRVEIVSNIDLCWILIQFWRQFRSLPQTSFVFVWICIIWPSNSIPILPATHFWSQFRNYPQTWLNFVNDWGNLEVNFDSAFQLDSLRKHMRGHIRTTLHRWFKFVWICSNFEVNFISLLKQFWSQCHAQADRREGT